MQRRAAIGRRNVHRALPPMQCIYDEPEELHGPADAAFEAGDEYGREVAATLSCLAWMKCPCCIPNRLLASPMSCVYTKSGGRMGRLDPDTSEKRWFSGFARAALSSRRVACVSECVPHSVCKCTNSCHGCAVPTAEPSRPCKPSSCHRTSAGAHQPLGAALRPQQSQGLAH